MNYFEVPRDSQREISLPLPSNLTLVWQSRMYVIFFLAITNAIQGLFSLFFPSLSHSLFIFCLLFPLYSLFLSSISLFPPFFHSLSLLTISISLFFFINRHLLLLIFFSFLFMFSTKYICFVTPPPPCYFVIVLHSSCPCCIVV